MRRRLLISGLVPATLLLLGVLLALHPFDLLNQGLDKLFGAPPKWAQVENLFQDRTLQEISRGERPLQSFSILSGAWKQKPGDRKVIFVGNSQMQAVSLAAGEPPPKAPEKTYVDQVAEHCQKLSPPTLCYRLSAPGMSYMEALWYLEYFVSRADLRPDVFVVQVNYQAFWQTGIRDGMLEMLQEAGFRARIREQAASSAAYAETFRDALTRFEAREKKRAANAAEQQAGSGITSKTGLTEAYGFGFHWETAARDWLGQWSWFRDRRRHKDEALDFLYRCRLYLLRLKPSTARSITGPRLERSQASLEAIAEACRKSDVRLVLFQAPLNPQVQLYRSEDDRQSYLRYVDNLKQRYGLTVFDFEKSVPAAEWGRWYNGPDPLHLGRTAHQRMSQLMIDVVDHALKGI